MNVESTYDWERDVWNVPVNLGISQILPIGRQLVSLQLGGEYYVEAPHGAPEWGARLTVTFLSPKRWATAMRLASSLALLRLIAVCSTVHVREVPVDDHFTARRGDVLTTGHLSASSRETLLTLGLDDRACSKDVAACMAKLIDARAVDDEARLATIAELHL